MDVQEVRRRNLIWLLQQFRDSHPKTTDKDFAVEHDINPKHLSQIKNRSKGARDIGNALARRIEVALKAERGWLDQPQWSGSRQPSAREVGGAYKISHHDRMDANNFSVPRLDVRASMGKGTEVQTVEERVLHRIDLDEDWVRTQFRILSSARNLTFIVGWGDSMSPTYNHGDILFVDTGVTEVNVDAVYVFTLRDELFVKRLQRLPESLLRVISDNKQYEPYMLDLRARKEMRTHGRVLGAMNWRTM